MERRIELVIAAHDDYSAALNKFNSALGGVEGAAGRMGGGLDRAGASTDKIGKELDKLTSASEYAASGLKKINNIISGMAFGAVIGAVSAVTQTLINHYKETVTTEEQVTKLNSAVTSQAGAWKLLPDPMKAVTQETVNLYNAQLKYLQLLESDKGAGLEKQIRDLELMRRNAEINLRAQPGRADYFEKAIAKYNVKISEARIELERWRSIMGLTPMTVERVGESLTTAAEKFKDPMTGGSLSAFILGPLETPDLGQKLELTGLQLGGKLLEGFNAATKETEDPFAIGDLDFSSRYITRLEDDRAYTEAYLAMTEERYLREMETEEMMFARHIADSERRMQLERQIHQQKLSLQFAAANQAAAILAIMGQKNKAAALASLAIAKGLAMAQVFIQSKAAAALAQATVPPPAGQALAASIETWGYINMALIAATGLVEASMGGGRGTASGVGGGGGVGALPIQPPEPLQQNTRPQIIFRVERMELLDENSVDRLVERINDRTDYDVVLEATRLKS